MSREQLKLWMGAGLLLLTACGESVPQAAPDAATSPVYEATAGTGAAAATSAGDAGKPAAGSGSAGNKSPTAGTGVSGHGAAGSGAGGTGALGAVVPKEALSSTTDFESADRSSNSAQTLTPGKGAVNDAAGSAGTLAAAPPTVSGAGGLPSSRAVERGDIYRVLPDQRILNLNSYRGVQIIDVSALDKPRIEGRLAVTGDPVELYVVNDRAIVLLNNWQGYYGTRDDVKVESVQGGLIMNIDIHDRAHPKLLDQAVVPGSITTSRLTQGGAQAALYVTSQLYTDKQRTVVKSFDASGEKFVAKSELDLGGYVLDIQATTDILMVAINDWEKDQGRSRVSIVDISRPDGTMVQGGSVLVKGQVQNKFNMDAYKGVLRVVSGVNGNNTLTNHLETFSLKNLDQLTPLHTCAVGKRDPASGVSESLYATLFVENRAFFVTYLRKDPFHAFSVGDDGSCQEHNEFIVSGWNDFLRATLADTRLVGIGINDANNTRKLSVSLYDAVDLTNPDPLKARADIDLAGAYSEANWDDRGFSVVEDAVSVKTADGSTETGLVLLPYSAWDDKAQKSVSQVQIFTFSANTLTKRGIMDHGTPVRRSFQVKSATTANLSQEQLSLFDTQDPAAPKELSRLDVAPNYTQVFAYGDHIARVRQEPGNDYYYRWQGAQGQTAKPNQVQVLSLNSDVDGSAVLATFEVPSSAELKQVGSLLVSIATTQKDPGDGVKAPTYTSQIQVFDLSDPTQPKKRGSLETDRITPNYYGGIYPLAGKAAGALVDCFDCGGRYYPYQNAQSFVVGQAIAFLHTTSQQKSIGSVTQCYVQPEVPACMTAAWPVPATCDTKQYAGGMSCVTPQGGQETCTGSFYTCDNNGSCTPTTTPPPKTTKTCSTYEQFRYWTSYAVDSLDLRNPDAPALAERLSLPDNEEGTSVIAAGATLYVNYQRPFTKATATQALVKHYVHLVDLSNPAQPASGKGINIPGDVIAAFDTTLYTRDFVWDEQNSRTLVSRLTLSGDVAHQQAKHLFEDREVTAVKLDGAGHVLVSSNDSYAYPSGGTNAGPFVTPPAAVPPASAAGVSVSPALPATPVVQTTKLSILDAIALDTVGEADVDSWATFQDAAHGRALYQVPGGLLVLDVLDPKKPTAQAYFTLSGWPSTILFDGQWVLFAAGPYGVYRFDASGFNLLTK
ncbi:MAG: hypothetical protein RL701_2846 [Pseudomonadota bacterium]